MGEYEKYSNNKISGYKVNIFGMFDTIDYLFEYNGHIYDITFMAVFYKIQNKVALSSKEKLILESFNITDSLSTTTKSKILI